MKKKFLFIYFILLFSIISFSKKIENIKKLTIALPGGAPSVAQIYCQKDNSLCDCTILNGADNIKAAFLNESYDLIYAPSNLGASIYNKNKTYKLLSGITFGNLYFASKEKIEKIEDLNDKKVVLFGQNTINDKIVTNILSFYNINADISYLSDTAQTKLSFLASSDDSVYLIADPLKSACNYALSNQNINSYYLSVQSLFKNINNVDGFSQACLFVNSKTYSSSKDLINNYLNKLNESIDLINNEKLIIDNNKLIKEFGYFDLPNEVLKDAIIGSNIRLVKGSYMKNIFEETYKSSLNLIGGKLPDEEFYI